MKQSMISQNTKLLITCLNGCILLVLVLISKSAYGATYSFRAATMVMEFNGEKLTAMINAVPLKQAIKEFSESTGVEVVWQGRETERMVQVRFIDLSVDDAARKLLRNENYILYYSSRPRKEKLEKIVIVPRRRSEEDQGFTPQTTPEARMFTMAEGPELEIPEWDEMEESMNLDNQELIEIIGDQLLLEGETEKAEALMQGLKNVPNL